MANKALISSSLPGVHDDLCYYGYAHLRTVLKYIVDKYNLLLIFIMSIYTNAKVIIRR